MKKYISFDIGGTKVKYSLLLEDGTFLKKNEYLTRKKNLDEFLNDLFSIVTGYESNNSISGISVSMPGFVNPKTGYTEFAGAITVLNNKNLKSILEDRFPYQVEIENDCNCVALAEKFNGNAKNCRDFVCVTIGTGVGGSIFLNNAIYHGHSFKAGEIGYMLTPGSQIGNEVLNDNSSTSGLINMYRKYKDIDKSKTIDGKAVFKEAKTDKQVNLLIDKWIEKISFGILNVTAVVNPEKILIGGGVSVQKEIIPKLENNLKKLIWWDFIKVPIEYCEYQNDAGMIGALYNFLIQNKK